MRGSEIQSVLKQIVDNPNRGMRGVQVLLATLCVIMTSTEKTQTHPRKFAPWLYEDEKPLEGVPEGLRDQPIEVQRSYLARNAAARARIEAEQAEAETRAKLEDGEV